MTAQLELSLDAAAEVREAFEDGRLRTIVDEKEISSDRVGMFVDDTAVKRSTPIRLVHVVSIPARGEIRGYVIVDGELRERGPKYMPWPEIDAEVSRRLGLALYRRRAP